MSMLPEKASLRKPVNLPNSCGTGPVKSLWPTYRCSSSWPRPPSSAGSGPVRPFRPSESLPQAGKVAESGRNRTRKGIPREGKVLQVGKAA